MIGAARKVSGAVAAIIFGLAVLVSSNMMLAFAQDEAEPEASPTSWSPITQGDVERAEQPEISATPQATPVPLPPSIIEPPAITEPPVVPLIENTPTENPTTEETPSAAASPSPQETPASTSTPEAEPEKHTTISRAPKSSRSHRGRSKPEGATSAATPASEKAAPAASATPNSPFAGLNMSGQKGPTNIKSDSLNLDYQNKAIIFIGHVHAVQAGGDLTSDKLRVQYGADFHDIKMMYADGNVRISQGTRWVTGDHAVLDQTKHTVVITGNPVVHDGEDQITGTLITVDLVTGKSTVEHPRVVIFPRESKSTDNVDSPDRP
jgi:lipopolysaccharide transport protein LptA